MMDTDAGRVPSGQALVSDEAAAHLHPSGFDPSRDQVTQLREMLLESVGGFDRFESTFAWRTFQPKNRAESELRDGINCLEGAMAELAEAGIDGDRQRAWLSSAVSKWSMYQRAGSRTANWMITGPARFPKERNEKAMRVERRRMEEFYAYTGGAHEWARRQVRIEQRRAAAAEDAASGVAHVERAYGNVRVILNTALNRVQIVFPDRLTNDERRVLKSHAFRWAPSLGAWQRQLTRNGVRAAKDAMQELGLGCDSDGSGEAGETQGGSTEGNSAGPQDIAQSSAQGADHAD